MFIYQGEGKISRSELYRCCEVSDVKRCSRLAVCCRRGSMVQPWALVKVM